MAAHHHHHHHHQLLEEKSSRESNNNMMVSSSSSSFCYSDVVPHLAGVSHHHHHLQSFDSNPEIYNLTSGIEMIGFQPKPPNNNINNNNNNTHHHHDDHDHDEVQNPNDHLIVAQQHHQHQNQEMGFMDESSIRPCVFPCEGNERPSQGLSLSLSSSNPSTISLQSFELRHNFHQRFNLSSPSSNPRDGFLGKSQSFHQHEQHEQQQQQIFLGKSVVDGSASSSSSMSLQFELMRNSKYMGPTQELLIEFCNLGTKQNSDDSQRKKQPLKKNKEQWEFEEGEEDDDHNNNNTNNASSSSSSRNANTNPSLYGVSLLELQKRKTKLLAMLEELDRRYKNYCEQMKGVVSSFEAVAGPRAANVYSALASKAMSRHFRCLRDSIVTQIKATKKAMGEKDSNNATILGTTRGETPRLRILDQNLRQQRAYQQMTMMESHPWRPQRGLPERSVSILRAWLFEHFLHPYPSDVDKHILARQTGLTRSQVSNWFINARVRLWKPMVEQMYLEETKEQQDKNMGSSSDGTDHQPSSTDHLGGLIPPPPPQDQKPDPDQLIRIDPGSLSSIVNTTATTTATSSRDDPQNRISHHLQFQQSGQFIGRVEGFGSMDHMDFSSSSSYNQQNHHATPFGSNANDQNDNNTPHQTFGGGNGGGNNVSLTLGLQQHGGNGVSLAFSPVSQTTSLFYPRDHMDDCQPVHHQYSLLDGDQGQNLPYRNLMGAQVLQDFA